ALGGFQHPAAARTAVQSVRRPLLDLPALLRAQDDVRESRRGVRRLPGRLRHGGRALRGADPDSDGQGLPLPRRPGRRGLLGGAARLGPRRAPRRRDDLSGGPRPALRDGRSGRGCFARARLLQASVRREPGGTRQGRRAVAFSAMRLRDLPSVDELARGNDDPRAVAAARSVLGRAREQIRAGENPGDLAALLDAELAAGRAPRLRRVINATGVIVHTNLGRAPLAEAAIDRVREVAAGYSNLEYDLVL